MIAKIEIPLDGEARREITDRMSDAMGGFIEQVGKTDFAQWAPEDWDRFVNVAYDICAVAVFTKRIVVIPPADIEYQPPY